MQDAIMRAVPETLSKGPSRSHKTSLTRRGMMMRRWPIMVVLSVLAVLIARPVWSEPDRPPANLAKVSLYLTAGDYRRALEACQHTIDDTPSAASYIHLTYVYHAIAA